MISFSFLSRDKRSKTAPKRRSSPSLEEQLFGKPRTAEPAAFAEIGMQDWVKSSRELRDGCEVQDIDLETLPADLAQSFQR